MFQNQAHHSITPVNLNTSASAVSDMQKSELEWVLTGVGDVSSPAQAVQTNGGAL